LFWSLAKVSGRLISDENGIIIETSAKDLHFSTKEYSDASPIINFE